MQTTTSLRYEIPLTKRSRLVLKLHGLFKEFNENLSTNSYFSGKQALSCLMDILQLLERVEIKMELNKEAGKFPNDLKLQEAITTLSNKPGKIGEEIRNQPSFAFIQKRLTLLGGTSSFDVPFLHRWLHLDKKRKIDDLSELYEPLEHLHQCIDLLIAAYEQSFKRKKIQITNGLLHHQPEQNSSLLVIEIPEDAEHLIPEVSYSVKAIYLKFWHQGKLLTKPEPFSGSLSLSIAEC
jgi:cell division protein ZapD